MNIGPKITKDGLILSLDAANVKSFKGEPTINLLYDAGVINFSIGNLTLNTSLSTITLNDKYRITSTTFISPYTFGSFRFYLPLSKLVNGQTYTLSYKYRILTGTIFSMNDWNDTTIFNVVNYNIDDYKFSSASGTRATYDGTFRFMDFNMSENTTVDIWDIQLEQKTYSTPFVKGTRGTTVATGGGWADLSGRGNNTSFIGSVTHGKNLLDYVSLNGIDSGIEMSAPILTQSTTFTFNILVNVSADDNNGVLWSLGTEWGVFYSNSSDVNGSMKLTTADGNTTLLVGSDIRGLGWIYISLVKSISTYQIFIDGVLDVTADSTKTILPQLNVLFGKEKDTSKALLGKISLISIYDRALSQNEIMENINAYKSRISSFKLNNSYVAEGYVNDYFV